MSFEEYSDGREAYALRRGLSDGFAPFEDDILGDEQPEREEVFKGSVKSPSAVEGGWDKPPVYGVYQLVGTNPEATSGKCRTFQKVVGCSQGYLHKKVIFDKDLGLVNCAGKGYFRPVFNSCDKPLCPKCYERGWAVRQAGSMDFRLGEAAKEFGEVVHAIVALPPKFWELTYEELRHKCLEVLISRGFIGGGIIFHGFRYASREESKARGVPFGWRWAPHFHVLGFILGGYKCRGCPKCEKGCGGFVDRNYRLNERDGCYVKVKGKRKSVFGTAFYQLHHATVKTDVKRFHVVTWFGVCSYHALKLSKEQREAYDEKHRKKCPICGSELVKHEYCGRNPVLMRWFTLRLGARDKVEGVFDGVSDWREVAERGSGSYE